jgi:hypothetical protein
MPSVCKLDKNVFEILFGEGDVRDENDHLVIPYEHELEKAIQEYMQKTYGKPVVEPEPEWEYKSCHSGCIDSDVCSPSCQMRKYYRRRPGGEWEEY